MKQETAKQLADGLNALTASTGVGSSAWGLLEYWDFVNTNAAGLGVLITIFFGLIAIAFNLYNSSKLRQSDTNKNKLLELDVKLNLQIKETREEFKSINSGLDKIFDKLNKGK